MPDTSERFIFRKQEKIGVLDARDDKKTLLDNFIDTGDYENVRDFDSPERFILGRTGSGKTALITKLIADEKHVIQIDPESLSLIYISNSTLIRELTRLGVNFDLFFRLLWRHVLCIEVLKYHFDITNEEKKLNVVDRLKEKFKNLSKRNNHSKGLEYLDNFGSSFWLETDLRIKEIVTKMETDIETNISAGDKILAGKIKTGESLSEMQKAEVVKRAQDVIGKVQMKELSDILKMIDDAVDDRQKKYYVVIDRLDEKWVEDGLRYQLIMALLETVKDFSEVDCVKPMVVLRNDLVNRVFALSGHTGLQEEKFSSLNLNISWNREQLTALLDSRIDYLIKKQYSGGIVSHKDVLVSKVSNESTIDYMLDRTLMRPRDIISFFNFCIEEASDRPTITEDMILKAERNYSRDRRTAIINEWRADYPFIDYWDSLLNFQAKEFFVSDIDKGAVEEMCLTYDTRSNAKKRYDRDLIGEKLNEVLQEIIGFDKFTKFLVQVFYQVGYLGVRLPGYDEPIWSYEPRKILRIEEMQPDTIFCVHKCFWSCFNIKP